MLRLISMLSKGLRASADQWLKMPSIFAKKKKLQQGENWESPLAQNGDRMALMRLEDIGIRGDRSQSSGEFISAH
jgi:hypothetical protein